MILFKNQNSRYKIFNILNKHNIFDYIMIVLFSSYLIFNIYTPSILIAGFDKLKSDWINSDGVTGDIRPIFLRNNLIIDWDFYGSLYTDKLIKVKRAYFGGVLSGPIFINDNEKKPYYLFNLHINYVGYPLKLFRNFTKGDGTIEYIDDNDHIIAVVFYKSEYNKLKKIKRKINNIVWDNNCVYIFGECKIMGIMYLDN